MTDINNNNDEMKALPSEYDLVQVTDEMLSKARASIDDKDTMKVPIAELSTLGAGIASIIPQLNTVKQTMEVSGAGLYRVVNMGANESLKVAKNGDLWGAFKNSDGKSIMARFQEAGPMSATTNIIPPINPAVMMMAVALFSIEREISRIADMGEQILSFLRIEKESEIEADVEMLMDMIKKYKLNWDNDQFVTSNHKLVMDIQRTARKNMNGYQKSIEEALKEKQLIVAQHNVKSKLAEIEKKFQYYRLSLYSFALASMMEIMLGGNYEEEYITEIKNEISSMSNKYRELFDECSRYLEKMSNSALESNVMKGVGTAGKAVGKLIGSIPLVKEGPVDEFLQESGESLEKNASDIEKEAVKKFAVIGNPETGMFINKMEEMVLIYNHTSELYIDDKNIYLIADQS